MKTSGLRGKKPAMARAAWHFAKRCSQSCTRVEVDGVWVPYRFVRIVRWHRAAKGRK